MDNDKELFLKKFEDKLKQKLSNQEIENLENVSFSDDSEIQSKDYETFRKEALSKNNLLYEKICNYSEKILNVKPDKKVEEKLQKYIYLSHLKMSPSGAISFAVLVSICVLILSLISFLIFGTFFGVSILIIAGLSFMFLQNFPFYIYKQFKSKASDQVIIAIFYLVAFMRFSSNFERAVHFASNNLEPPLSLDFKRIIWELNNAKYSNIKDAFDNYLEDFREDSLEFLESIYLIESSLFESEEFRRVTLLDKALDIILQSKYEKMISYAQELRGKVSTFNMLGVVLPILGLIILPLAAATSDDPRGVWNILFLIYNIIFPLILVYFSFTLIFNRPSQLNSTPKIKENEDINKTKIKISKNKLILVSTKSISILIFCVFFLIGAFPLIIGNSETTDSINKVFENTYGDGDDKTPDPSYATFSKYTEINPDDGEIYFYGPYGLFPGLLSLFLSLSFALSIGFYLKSKYKNLISLRDKTKLLEREFPSAIFQLGNRINEGISPELSFGLVADSMKKTEVGEFFSAIDKNVKFNGYELKKAIFDNKKGAILKYPSKIIESSMNIFITAKSKGVEITSKTLIDLSKYLNQIHLANERLKDLLSESVSSMQSQAKFLAPLISGVVVSIISLVTFILGTLKQTGQNLQTEAIAGVDAGGVSSILKDSIPTYWFQLVVGFYITFLIFILTYVVVNLQNGNDKILTKYQIGSNLISGGLKYGIIVFFGIIGFSFIGSGILENL